MSFRPSAMRWLLAISVTAVGLIGLARGDHAGTPKPVEPRPSDKPIYDVLRDIHNRGADLYNGGDPVGAYRLFQGALMAVRPILDHRPDIQRRIDLGLGQAERSFDMRHRAMTLHFVIEDVRKDIKAADKKSDDKKPEDKKDSKPPESQASSGNSAPARIHDSAVEPAPYIEKIPAPRVLEEEKIHPSTPNLGRELLPAPRVEEGSN